MKIAFISTRGIPNNYGGFEQFADVGMRLWYIHLISILIKKTLIKEYV